MQGNYTQAKTELLDYFRNRTTLSALDPDSINRLDIVTKYKNTGNESYANSYINEMMGVIAEGEAGSNDIGSYPKYDQVGLRGNFWMRAYHVFKNSASLSPEENTDLLKTFWKQANFAGGGFYTTGNLSVLAVLGGYSIAIYFPEFAKSSEWMPHFRDNIDYLTSTLALSDGSYEESTDYYVPLSVGWLTDIKRLAVLNNDSLNTAAIDDTNRKLVKYVTDLSYPNGHGVMFGDSHDSDHRPFVSGNANRFNEPTFRHFATLGAQGVSPSYTSTLYPVS
jgi:hypothetical protein